MQLGLMWDDLPWLIQPDPDPQQASTSASMEHPFTEQDAPPPLAVLVRLIEQYVAVTLHQLLACALWAMHTLVYDRYSITPRLFVTSPVENCGKSTLMKVLTHIIRRADKYENITTAALYRSIDADPNCTRLLDEGENLNGMEMRYVLNANAQGDKVTRTIQGQPRDFVRLRRSGLQRLGRIGFMLRRYRARSRSSFSASKRATKLREV